MQDTQVTVPNDELFALLREHLSQEKVQRVADVLAPFYAIAKSGELFPFKGDDGLNTTEIATAIQGVFGLNTLPEIVFYSASAPFPKPEWMSEEVYQEALEYSLGENPWITDLKTLKGMVDELGVVKDVEILTDSFSRCLDERLSETIRDCLGVRTWNNLDDNPGNSLLCFVNCVFVDDEPLASAIEAVIQVQSHGCIILGPKDDDFGTWIVVCR